MTADVTAAFIFRAIVSPPHGEPDRFTHAASAGATLIAAVMLYAVGELLF